MQRIGLYCSIEYQQSCKIQNSHPSIKALAWCSHCTVPNSVTNEICLHFPINDSPMLFREQNFCSSSRHIAHAGFLAQHCKEDAHTNISKPPLKCFYISQHYQYYWFIHSDLPQPGQLQNWDLINVAHFQLISLLKKVPAF